MVSLCHVFHSNLSKKLLIFGDDHPALNRESLIDLIETTLWGDSLTKFNQISPNLQQIIDITWVVPPPSNSGK